MRYQYTLNAQVERLHDGFGFVVAQHAHHGHRAAGKTALNQPIDRSAVGGAVLGVDQHEIEAGVTQ